MPERHSSRRFSSSHSESEKRETEMHHVEHPEVEHPEVEHTEVEHRETERRQDKDLDGQRAEVEKTDGAETEGRHGGRSRDDDDEDRATDGTDDSDDTDDTNDSDHAKGDRGSDDSGDSTHPGKVETTTFEDRNGVKTAVSHLEVATVDSPRLEKAQFTFAQDGTVTGMLEGRLDREGDLTFRPESIEAGESLTSLTIKGVRYVLVQETELGRVEFGLYRDDNKDGVWTEVLEGHLLGTAQDVVTLVGSTPQLDLAAGIVG